MKIPLYLPPLLIALAAPLPTMADAYKCRQPNGQTEISNRPCPVGSSTVSVKQDEVISEARRREAERDVERMRSYVERREAEQRAATPTAPEASAARSVAPASPLPARRYGDPEACLQGLEQQVLEASQRARLEAECRNLVTPPANNPQPGYLPGYGGVQACMDAVMQANLPPAERQRRIAQCAATYPAAPPVLPHGISPESPLHRSAQPASAPRAPSIVVCPPADKNCR